MRSDKAARRLGRNDAARWKRGVATEQSVSEMMDTYVNDIENDEAYVEGFCEGACANPDVDCLLNIELRR